MTEAIQDQFVPVRLQGAELIEIISKYKAREYVLVNPETRAFDCFGVKDRFVWECIDGERNLGQIKQEYYNRFKALPTQHISNLIRRWASKGLVEGEEVSDKGSFRGRGKPWYVFDFRIPAGTLSKVIGPLTGWMNNLYFALLMLLLGLSGFGATVATGKLEMFLSPSHGDVSAFKSLLILIAWLYVFAVLRVFLRLGALPRRHAFKGDAIHVGLHGGVPFMGVSTRGLVLSPWEFRMGTHLSSMLLSLPLGGIAALVLLFVPDIPELYRVLLTICVQAGIADFLLQTCPFIRSGMIRLLDEWTPGRPVRFVATHYLKNWEASILQRPREETRVVIAFFGVIFLWTVLGGSVFLLGASEYSEALNSEASRAFAGNTGLLQAVEAVLKLPIFLLFAFLLWQMVQPWVRSVIASEQWEDAGWSSAALTFAALVMTVGFYFLDTFILAVFFFLVLLVENAFFKKTKHHHSPVLVFAAAVGAVLCLHVFVVFAGWNLPGQDAVAGALLASSAAWLLFAYSPSSMIFRIRLYGVAVLLALAVAVIPFFFSSSLSSAYIYALPAGLFASGCFNYFRGSVGAHFAQGAIASLMFFAAAMFPEAGFSDACFAGAVLLVLHQVHGLRNSTRREVNRLPRLIQVNLTDSRVAIDRTLAAFLENICGPAALNFHRKDEQARDFRFLRLYDVWLRRFLTNPSLINVLKCGLAASAWKDRMEWAERLPTLDLAKQESKSKLDLKRRIAFLKSQFIFRGFKSEELRFLAEYLEPAVYRKGDKIVGQSESVHPWLEIIAKGQASLLGREPESDEEMQAELTTGDSIRVRDLFQDMPYEFGVTARDDCLCIRLHRAHFRHWLLENSGFLERVLEAVELGERVAELSLFRDFSAAQMRLLLTQLERLTVKKGDKVIRQGEEGDRFYLIYQGDVDVIVNKRKVAKLSAGSYFGEIALLQKTPRTATIRAAGQGVLYSLSQESFDHFFATGRGAQVLQNVSSKRKGGGK